MPDAEVQFGSRTGTAEMADNKKEKLMMQILRNASTPLRMAAYYRTHREDTRIGVADRSLVAQRHAARQYCVANGYELVGEYADLDARGETVVGRAQLQWMLQAAHYGMIDAVLVHRVDRLGRSTADLHHIAKALTRAGVQLISVTQPQVDLGTNQGLALYRLHGEIAELELAR